MNKIKYIIFALFPILANAQSFAPPAGQVGSTAIHKDSSIFIGWATTCVVERGYLNTEDYSLGYATFGADTNAIGKASGISTSVVSLGDGGMATLSFAIPIANGAGPDFAVFENGVTDGFLEIGFVEVSSDGTNFVRFPAISEVQTSTQVGGFGIVDCRYIHNFAGKYRVGFGTPFDLEDIKDSVGIDVNNITHVRIVDVVGSIDPLLGTYDSQGTIVNNLHPTPFESSGFDLDGVGIINTRPDLGIQTNDFLVTVYPNPVKEELYIYTQVTSSFSILDIIGNTLFLSDLKQGNNSIDVSTFPRGIYFIQTNTGSKVKFVKD